MSRHVSSHKRQAVFDDATLEEADFESADLTGATFQQVKAKEARLA